METHIIPDDDQKGKTIAFIGEDVEFTDPVAYYADREKTKTIVLQKQLLFAADPVKAAFVSEDFYIKNAEEKWQERYAQIMEHDVPDNFILLLKSTSKKEQEKLLRGQSLTPFQLAALLFRASQEFGYSFSNYTAEHHHKGLDENALPAFIEIKEDGTVKTAGETTLSEGQLKNVINQRRVTVAKFLDKGDEWHCFFTVYRSLRGEESWKDGQPHFHYISDKWGISRKDAVEQLKGDKYPSTSVHIALNDYGGKKEAPNSSTVSRSTEEYPPGDGKSIS